MRRCTVAGSSRFLSTLSLRRATPCQGPALRGVYISIHALLAESDGNRLTLVDVLPISIHALLAESDCKRTLRPRKQTSFLSTLSLRRATGILQKCRHELLISIHALLAESDEPGMVISIGTGDISIHALLAESDVNLNNDAGNAW